MLICNYVVDQLLMNGLVGCIQKISYRSPTGTLVSGSLPAYIFSDFPNFLIREYHKLFSDKPRACAPTPMDKFQCKK